MSGEDRVVEGARAKVDDSTPVLKGVGLAEDASSLASQFGGGDWSLGLVSVASAGFEVRDLLQDPVAKLVSMGLSWLIEFVEPLNSWLDALVGDDQQLAVAASTWTGISGELKQAAEDLDGAYKRDTAAWSGPAVEQYKVFCADRVELYKAGSSAATVTAGIIDNCKSILGAVREIVRTLVTDAIGKLVSIVCRYPPPATPAATPEISTTVVQYSNKIMGWVKRLKGAFANAGELLKQSRRIFSDLRAGFANARMFAKGSRRTEALWNVVSDVPDLMRQGGKAALKDIPENLGIGVGIGGAKVSRDIGEVLGGGDSDGEER